MEKQVEYVANSFIRTLQSVPEVIDYLEALSNYKSDEKIINLTERYYSLSAEFQKKQYEGTLTQDEINEIRTIASQIQNDPLNTELTKTQNQIKEILQQCNVTISHEISMDFAKLAVPESGCCG
ncbi:MAG: hypothetical protein CO129_00375 [Ignavibacteriales bacterium CG_4_9_14_3_um_filter_34_10]|nr:MAG: hypothetical protein CO129_00375 [Ignavibacteriales bacterium CG_4_9_14_3_um_filter_34_10]